MPMKMLYHIRKLPNMKRKSQEQGFMDLTKTKLASEPIHATDRFSGLSTRFNSPISRVNHCTNFLKFNQKGGEFG
jgi:hypothetical protein